MTDHDPAARAARRIAHPSIQTDSEPDLSSPQQAKPGPPATRNVQPRTQVKPTPNTENRTTTGKNQDLSNTECPISHDRVRHDIIDTTGAVSLRVHGKLHHIGIGRTHARTHVTMLIHDLDVTIINTATGEILRELTIDPTRNYQPRTKQK